MKTLDLGEELLLIKGWCISKEIGETHLILARGTDRSLYDCRTDKIIGTIQTKKAWNSEQRIGRVNPAKLGGLKKIIALFSKQGLEKISV